MSLHRSTHRLRHHKPYLGACLIRVGASASVHHDIGLHRPHPLIDCGTEFRRPRHPVPRRKHRAGPASFTQSACDGPYRAGRKRSPGPPVSASAAETHGPAHGAGCWAERSACPWPRLSLLVASGNHIRRTGLEAIPVGKLFVSLANRRGLRVLFSDRSRVTTYGRLFEGTDEISLGQTHIRGHRKHLISHSSNRSRAAEKLPPGNVAERLAYAQKTC